MKTCTKCKQTKPMDEFARQATSKDGYSYHCLECKREYGKSASGLHKAKRRQETPEGKSYCSRCDDYKDVAEFVFDQKKQTPTGYCADCRKEYRKNWESSVPEESKILRTLQRYNFSQKKYQEMLEAQSNVCAICGGKNENGRALYVDHDHSCCPGNESCGKCIRGLLCAQCNSGLGYFKDRVDNLEKAIDYLTDYEVENYLKVLESAKKSDKYLDFYSDVT